MSSEKKIKKQKSSNIKVLIRCRPLLQFQIQPAWEFSSSNKIQCMQTKSVKLKVDKESRRSEAELLTKFKQMKFQFQKVYQDKSTSQQIYKIQTRQIVQQSLKTNKNLTLMCYGQTCSGKTFTILGEQKFPGLMPCLLRDLMIYKRQKSELCNIKMTYFEIYNESIYDLLTQGKKNLTDKLKIYEDKKYGWQVAGLRVQRVETFDDCIRIIQKGEKNRSYASKQNHDRSSRSHTIMRVYIEKQDQNYNKTQQIFNILDLAGSQRLSQFSKNPQQTASINKSLFQLSNVISKLSANDPGAHIPFRDSKLTKLMQSSLKGSGKCVIVFCISPAVQSFNETLATLRLAKKAKTIEVSAQQQDLISNWSPLQKQLFQTRQKLAKKEVQCQQLEYRLNYLSNELSRLESYIDEIQNKSSVNINLTVLADHQNFIIKDSTNNSTFSSLSQLINNKKIQNQLEKCQQYMKQSLKELYQNYIDDVISIYFNQLSSQNKIKANNDEKVLIQISQFTFKNMVFDQSLQLQIKLKGVQCFINGLKNSPKNTKNQFLLELAHKYHIELSNKIPKELNKSEQLSTYKKLSKINQNQQKQNVLKEIKQVDSKIQTKQCRNLYSWGCSKDGRLFKSSQILPGINSLSNQSYGVIKKIVTSFNHNMFLTAEGKIYSWGKNNFNQVSPKDTPSYSIPRQVNIKEKIVSIATGWGHSLALGENKKVYSWGYGQNGQLGHGNLLNVPKPKIIDFDNLFVEIYAGHSHSGVLDEKKQLYTFGFNKDYRCMIMSEEQFISIPKKIVINNIKSVSLGVSHSAIITQQNYVFCGGVGTNGEFGRQLQLQIQGCEFVEVENRIFQAEEDRYEKICPLIQFQFQSQFQQSPIQVRCTENTTYLLTNLRNLYICGKNFNRKNKQNIYQPKLILSNVQSFTAGSRHGFAFVNNQLYTWGFNMYNQLGNNKQKDLNLPEPIPTLSNLNLTQIQCGFIHTLALGQ